MNTISHKVLKSSEIYLNIEMFQSFLIISIIVNYKTIARILTAIN